MIKQYKKYLGNQLTLCSIEKYHSLSILWNEVFNYIFNYIFMTRIKPPISRRYDANLEISSGIPDYNAIF